MGVCLACVIFSSFILNQLSQGQGFEDNTTLIVNQTSILTNFPGTREWLADDALPQFSAINFTYSKLESVAVHFAWKYLVFSDRALKTIFVYSAAINAAVYAHVGTSLRVGHVTVDWLSNNVYWADTGMGWIGLQPLRKDIRQTSTNGASIKVVVSSSLDKPYGVVVLPHSRRLFWTDHGSPPKVESSDLVGRDRRTLVWQGLSRPTALSVDHEQHVLYWVDEVKGTVESCTVTGEGRRIVLAVHGSHFGGLQVFEEFIMVSERKRNELKVFRKNEGTEFRSLQGLPNPVDVAVFSSALQPRENATCDSMNCQHICIHGDAPSCVCATGYSSSDGGKHCAGSVKTIWKSFIVSSRTKICTVPINILFNHPYLDNKAKSNSVICVVDNSSLNIRHLAVDSHNASVFYVTGQAIRSYTIHSEREEELQSSLGDISGLAYDWAGKRLLWSLTNGSIYSLTQGHSEPTVVYSNLPHLSDLAVDSRRSALYWVEIADTDKSIQSGTINGTLPRNILNSGRYTPRNLLYDQKTDRLYWLVQNYIVSVDKNGGDIHRHILSTQSEAGLAVFRDYLIWLDDNSITFRDADLGVDDDTVTFVLPNKTHGVTDIVIYDAADSSEQNSCELDNGGCSQLCLAQGQGHMCQCHFGFQLGKDNISCITDYAASDFFLVADKLLGQLYQVKRSTKSVSAAIVQDGSIPEVVTFNPNTREIIWYDSRVAAIKLSSLNGSSANVVRTLKVANQAQPNTVGSLCVDQSTNNLFFTEISADNSQGWIRMISLERPGNVMRTLNRTIPPPRYLAIAPNAGILVFVTVNGTLHLTDMAMDGRSELLHSGVVNLSGLALTQDGSKVVWSDKDRDDITEMDFKTRATTTRLTNSKSFPHSLQIGGSDLYYLTSSGRSIKSLKEDRETTEIEFPEFGELTSLYFVGDDQSTDTVETACSIKNGRCSTFCLPTRDGGRRCQCTDGHHILEDMRTCSDVEKCTAGVKNLQLSTSCDRYPSETCTYTCNEGYRTSPKASTQIECGEYGEWKLTSETVCQEVERCTADVKNGQLSTSCDRYPSETCTYTCDEGYRTSPEASTQIECGEYGEWKLTSETVCQAIESSDTQLPVYAIAIIIIGVLALIVLLGGCFLYRRMKMYGGRNGRRQDLEDLPPVLFTTHGNAVRPPKDGEDDNSHDYAELDDVTNVSSYTRHPQLTRTDNPVYLDLLPAVIQDGEPSLPVSKRKTHLQCRAPQFAPGNAAIAIRSEYLTPGYLTNPVCLNSEAAANATRSEYLTPGYLTKPVCLDSEAAANATRSEYLTPGYLTKPVCLDSEAARSGGTEALHPSQAAAARGLSPLSNETEKDCVPSGSGMLRKMDKFGLGLAAAAESDYLTAVPIASDTDCLTPAQMSSRMGYLTASHASK